MESVIKWRTGEPKEEGFYIITLCGGVIVTDRWHKGWENCSNDIVIAWCPINEIKPYKG